MKYITIVLLAFAFVAGQARAESLDDANRAFAAGKYQVSLLGYQAVLAENGYSAPVLFDLGNAYYRQGDYVQAILAYQRAQWLAPGNRDIAANLQLAQKQAGITPAEQNPFDRIVGVLSASGWALTAGVAWWALCATFLTRAFLSRRASVFSLGGALSLVVLLVALMGMIFSSAPLRQAVITDKNATALISPFPAAQTLFSPAPGETVTIQKAYHDFDFVKDSAGHTGWISKAQLTPIVSSGSPS
jgi:tetratricopeptide (TPR) repeat protein